MDSNEKNLDNSLEGAMSMTQEEIELLLSQQETESSGEQFGFEDADLASLLFELGEQENDDAQEISDLLNRADNNEAVAEDVISLMNLQEAEGETAYDAMDLFSSEQTEKKEGFFQKLINKIKEKKKEKREKNAAKSEQRSEEAESLEMMGNVEDSMAEALALLNGENISTGSEMDNSAGQAKEGKVAKKKREKKPKKAKKEKKATPTESVGAEEKQSAEKVAKKKKAKKTKKEKVKKTNIKKTKEKKVKDKKANNEPIREKKPGPIVEQIPEEVEIFPHKNKIIMVFVAAAMIMLGFLVVNYYFTGHTTKKLAEEAYDSEDYLECYQLLYGQKLDDSQAIMFHQSEVTLKMNIFWNRYQKFVENNQLLESLDNLVQFLYEYPALYGYAAEWKCQDTVKATHDDVVYILEKDYQVSEQEVLDIAALEDDEEYTKALVELVDLKRETMKQEYPDILPPEQDRITQN
ncbi:MAG: hypothetical protein IJX63_16070 [Lachnospiraceae bacterium]|nr:hypothetical protein [Lachnospiraceae bacterium]